MKRLILNITLLVFMVLGSMSAIANHFVVKSGIANLFMDLELEGKFYFSQKFAL
ncbi:hypothetical protein AB4242_09375 [Vibrio splendidus]